MTTISLITASYNSARTITDTLRSVNRQTWPEIEYLVVDGGSKDDTMEIVAREGARVTSAVSEQDKGIYDAYNKGLSRATGDIIGFLNSDDYYCADDVIAQVPKLTLDEVTGAYNRTAKRLRLIDAAIQQANWTTVLEVQEDTMKDED